MEKTYELGEVVFERVRPNQKLIVMNRVGNLYYCVPKENLKRKALVFYARDVCGNIE